NLRYLAAGSSHARCVRPDRALSAMLAGTDGSNPLPSSGESEAADPRSEGNRIRREGSGRSGWTVVVIAAFLNALKPSITVMRCFTPRWSCSIRLFRYFDERSFVFADSEPSAFSSRTARCDAAQPSSVIVCGQRCWHLIALRKNALAAATSRLGLSLKSTVRPARSTARYRQRHSPRIFT